MIEINKEIDLIEIVRLMFIQIRQVSIVLQDKVEIARQNHRYVLNPLSDLSDQPELVKAIAAVVFTDKVKRQYKDTLQPPIAEAQPAS